MPSPRTVIPLDIRHILQVEEVKEEQLEVTSEPMEGTGARATPLGINPTVEIDDVRKKKIKDMNGEIEREGAGRGDTLPRMSLLPTMKPRPSMFILS